jgi:sugar phosphate isomerase/epimerase
MTRPPVGISGTEFVKEPDGLTGLLADAAAVGAQALEVWYPENFGADPDATAQRLLSAGITVACVASGSELGKADPEDDRRLLLEAITMAHRLGAPVANTYHGPPGLLDDRRVTDRYAAAVESCLDHAAAVGVTVVLENEFDAFGHDPHHGDPTRRPESLRRLVDLIGHPAFGLNFDAANFVCAGVRDVLGAFDLLADAVAYAHVKDVVAVRDEAAVRPGWTGYADGDRWYSTCPLGQGEVPWPELVTRMSGRVAAFTLEPHGRADRRTAAFAEAMTAFRKLEEDSR